MPSTPASIMRLTALPPAPPTPTTLMWAKVSRITSSQSASRVRCGAATGFAGTGVGGRLRRRGCRHWPRPSPGGRGSFHGSARERHFVGLPVVAAGAGRVPALGCGTACFFPIPERERLRWRCRAPDLPVRQAHPRVVLSVTAGKVTRAAHRTRRTSRGMTVRQIGAHPNPAGGGVRLVPRSNALPEYSIGPESVPVVAGPG